MSVDIHRRCIWRIIAGIDDSRVHLVNHSTFRYRRFQQSTFICDLIDNVESIVRCLKSYMVYCSYGWWGPFYRSFDGRLILAMLMAWSLSVINDSPVVESSMPLERIGMGWMSSCCDWWRPSCSVIACNIDDKGRVVFSNIDDVVNINNDETEVLKNDWRCYRWWSGE